MGLPHCPNCRKNRVHQSRRQGLIEALWSLLCIYPFRCQLCAHRFLAFQWWWRRFISHDDLREYVRFPVRFQATFSGKQVSGAGTVVNLSQHGCAIETYTPIPPASFFSSRSMSLTVTCCMRLKPQRLCILRTGSMKGQLELNLSASKREKCNGLWGL